jgi:AcrR family transcriptional regulator
MMNGKRGRPPKTDEQANHREQLLEAAVRIIRRDGAQGLTVRNVCEEAGLSNGTFYHYFQNKDDLMMAFVREESFDGFPLQTPTVQIARRITELYLFLIHKYEALGLDFMKHFYTTDNRALSAYMGQENGSFAEGTVMLRCERELAQAQKEGVLSEHANVHELSVDLCTIVKGCVFEWALNDGSVEMETCLLRIVQRYLAAFLIGQRVR